MQNYIYQQTNWPNFTYNELQIQVTLGKVRHLQGKICGQMSALGFSQQNETMLTTLTLDVLKSSEIEGEELNYEQVRSSIARKLGMDLSANLKSLYNDLYTASVKCIEIINLDEKISLITTTIQTYRFVVKNIDIQNDKVIFHYGCHDGKYMNKFTLTYRN